MPLRKATVPALCTTGPSASGSLKGMPTSIMLMPRRCSVRMTSAVMLSSGQPAQKYSESNLPGSEGVPVPRCSRGESNS